MPKVHHTPGPWHQGTMTRAQALYIFDSDGNAVVQAVEEKNVPLIAAAPELLESLEVLVSMAQILIKEGVLAHPNERHRVAQAVQRIKKAKGETV